MHPENFPLLPIEMQKYMPLWRPDRGNKHNSQPCVNDPNMLAHALMYEFRGKKFLLPFISLSQWLPQSQHLPYSTSFHFSTKSCLLLLPSVGQQPPGRPEEEKPLSEPQWARTVSPSAHFPPAGLSLSPNPTTGRHQPYWCVCPHPLPPYICSLQPGLLVYLSGQRHNGEAQVNILCLIMLVHLFLSVFYVR